MKTLTNALVTITYDATSLVINTTDAQAATVGQVPSAIDSIDFTWSRPSARDHADPQSGTLTLILDTERHPVIRWDALVTITGHVYDTVAQDGVDATLWRGWITGHTWERRTVRHPATGVKITTWQHTVTMTDLVGRAGSTKIGDTPWPAEPANDRLDRIEAVSPYPLISPTAIAHASVAGRDVDNIDILDPVRAAVQADLRWVHDSTDGLVALPLPANALAYLWGQSVIGVAGDDDLITLDAAWVHDAPRSEDRQARVTAAKVDYFWQPASGPAEQRTAYVRDPSATATAELSQTSDLQEWEVSPRLQRLPYLLAWCQSLIDLTRDPIAVLAETQLRVDRMPVHLVAWLVDLDGALRSRLWVRLTNAPDSIYTWQHITGGHVTIDGRRGLRLAITMQPTLLAGQRPLVWSDWPDQLWPGDVGETLQPVWGDAWAYWVDMTISTIPWSGQ